MKKWSATELTINCDDDTSFTSNIKFTYTPEVGSPVIFFTWQNFYDIMLERYTDFYYRTGSYHSSATNSEVEICSDLTEAIAKFKKSLNIFVADKQPTFEKLYYSIIQDYNPIHNYDKHIHSTMDYKGKETDDTTYTGQETDTLSKSGKELRTETPTGSETNTVTMNGKEKTTNVNGAKTDTTAVTAFDSGNNEWLNKEKKDGAQSTDTSETEYGSSGSTRQDTNTKTFTNRKTEDELSFTNRQDTNTKSFTNRKDTTEKSFTNRQDEYNYEEYGNIGITRTQEMILDQYNLAFLDEIRQFIVNTFVHKYLVI